MKALICARASSWNLAFVALLLVGCNGSLLSSQDSSILPTNIDYIDQLSFDSNNNDNDKRLLQSGVTLPFRINSGNTTTIYTDPSTNKVWLQDQYFMGNEVWNGCPEAARTGFSLASHLCQTRQRSSFEYNIPVPFNGQYKLTLYFVETIKTASRTRLFNVRVEGITLISSLDVFALAGGRMRPLVRTLTATVADGFLTIRFSGRTDKAMVSAIEIEDGRLSNAPTRAPTKQPIFLPTSIPTSKPTSKPTSIPTSKPTSKPTAKPAIAPVTQPTVSSPTSSSLSTVRINCGSLVPYVDPLTGNTWSADVNFQSGGRFSNCPSEILNTTLDSVFCTERFWGGGVGINGTYTIPVVPGVYTVRLLFAELFFNNIGNRVFNVYLQNRLLRSNLDVRAVTGGRNISYVVPGRAAVTTTDPNIRLTFQNIVQNGKIHGIEIIPYDRSVTDVPTNQPVYAPTRAPTNAFETILINCGSTFPYVDSLAREFAPDQYFSGGSTASSTLSIENTVDDTVYQSERVGDTFTYEIPVPIGSFVISLLLSENQYTQTGQRLFDVVVEGETLTNVDIFQTAGGAMRATKLQFFRVVEDDFLSIEFTRSAQFPNAGLPKVNGIEVALDRPHIAHAVATGPYVGTVVNPLTNTANVQLFGQTSHTHGEMLTLNNFTWKEGNTVLGTTVNTNYSFGVGVHTISLTIKDDGGNTDTESTTVSINPFGFPAITSLIPSSGNLTGQYPLMIMGSGFNYTSSQIKVMFGTTELTGSQITIINQTAISIVTPSNLLAQAVDVTIQTPLGTSVPSTFSFIGSIPLQWQEFKLLDFFQPTVGRFGPDSKLYVGTRYGRLLKVTLNSDFTSVVNTIVSHVNRENQESM
jgi:Malectin domain/IPT/TIG domain